MHVLMAKRARALVAGLLLSGGAGATTLSVEPGLWEVVWTINNPLSGQQMTDRRTECIQDREFNPRSLLREARGCEVVSEEQRGDRLSFSLVCTLEEGVTTRVDGVFQNTSTSGKGRLRTQVQMGGMEMKLDTEVATRRLGPCPTVGGS